MTKHIPIMTKEVLEALDIKQGVYVDATIGFGGHSSLILKGASKVIGIDQDIEALEHVESTIQKGNLKLYRANFSSIDVVLALEGEALVDGIFADIGVSSYQLDNSDRGFSYMHEGPLDMRMSSKKSTNAKYVVNRYSEQDLADIFWRYGEERKARIIAKKIVKVRSEKEIVTTFELRDIIERASNYNMSSVRRVFQAIRIEVNEELKSLEIFLKKASKLLKPNGRLAIISFHTLEDRIVKNFFKGENFEQLHKKVITPSEEEIIKNSRSKPAKLRYAARK